MTKMLRNYSQLTRHTITTCITKVVIIINPNNTRLLYTCSYYMYIHVLHVYTCSTCIYMYYMYIHVLHVSCECITIYLRMYIRAHDI